MSADYQVIWAKAAESDLAQIIRYIMQNSPATANEIFRKIKIKTEDLAVLPDRGRVVPELLSQGISLYREIIIAPWRVIYRIAEKTVFILAVIDSRRNVEDVLLERLIRTNNANPLP
ncbi:MAG: type II toxin-antitoxin system RelE/ParE family toxin [Methylobacter sp.]|nr:MAG: type II toxin-antitoxin system RelE/ParE family toxin [Methylobacter sp.]